MGAFAKAANRGSRTGGIGKAVEMLLFGMTGAAATELLIGASALSAIRLIDGSPPGDETTDEDSQ